MLYNEKMKCHSIIHSASVAAAGVGAGFAQVPGSDSALIVPIQVAMTTSLAKMFGITMDEATAKTTLATVTASIVGRTVSQFLVGWIPAIGNAINAATAATITEAIGWTLAKDFSARIRYTNN